MTIFTIFVGVVTSTFIVTSRALREANEVRKVYGEARFLTDRITQDVRLNTIDYECLDLFMYASYQTQAYAECSPLGQSGETTVLPLISADGQHRTIYRYDEGTLSLLELDYNPQSALAWTLSPGYTGFEPFETRSVTIEDVGFIVAPTKSPYDNFSDNSAQFQPSVNLHIDAKSTSSQLAESVPVQLQTTISSRVYGQTNLES